MEVINSDSVHLPQVDYREDDSRQKKLLYPEYGLPLPTSFIDHDIYKLHSGLVDKSWNIREKSLTKLLHSIPNLELDVEAKITKDILRLVTLNLGHIVSNVRRRALEVILAFIKYSKQPESVIKNMLLYGVDMATTDANLSLNTIQTVPIVLKYVKHKLTNLSHQLLAQVVMSLSKRMVQITHQRQVVSSLLKIKSLIGESLFDHFLETYYPQIKRDFDVLCNVYGDDYSDPSDYSDEEADSFFIPDDEIKEFDTQNETTDTQLEVAQNSDDEVIMKVYDEDGNEIKRTSSRRVTFGGEIVKIRTPDSDPTPLTNGVDEKLEICTDIVLHLSSDESLETGNESTPASSEENNLQIPKIRVSQIPLPIRPALNKPKHPRHPFPSFTQPSSELLNGSKCKDQDLLMEIPNYDGESLTSSSDSSDRGRLRIPSVGGTGPQNAITLRNNALQDLRRMKIDDKLVLENVFRKDDWRFYICGAERLAQILRQPFNIQNISSNMESTTGVSLLCYIFNVLTETKNNRVINSSLSVLKYLCNAMVVPTLQSYLDITVPTFCSYLGSAYESTIRIEAVELVKTIMRKCSPQKVVDVLFSESCFYSKSSKMRENSLLSLMYALITFPSTEFNLNEITENLIKHGVSEPKRRVRQALLDTLSILGQMVPRSKIKVVVTDEESNIFKRALRARLTRRQLPTVSPTGLIFYAFQISPEMAFGTDIEWILAGKGSLSDNCNRAKMAQSNYVYGEDMSPIHSEAKWSIHEKNTKFHKKNLCVQNGMQRGSSEETLCTNEKLLNPTNTDIQRYSADGWNDFKSSPSLFEPMYTRYPSTLSDTSSYASSYTSDRNFPRLYPGYEPNPISLDRPVSEDKLNQLPWPRNFSKHTLKLNPTVYSATNYFGYDSSVSLPVLNDKKDKSFKHVYLTEKVNCYSSDENRCRWSKIHENEENEFKYQTQTQSERIKRETQTCTSYENKKNDRDDLNQTNTQIENLDQEHGDKNKTENNKSDKVTINDVKDRTSTIYENKTKIYSLEPPSRMKNFLEKKAGVKLKRSLTKEIRIPQSTFSLDPTELPPFEHPKDGLQKTLLQFESRDWETVIEALQGVMRLARHHNKQLSTCLHHYVIAVAKEIRSLRSQVARAACLAAQNIFDCMDRICDQDIEELSRALFLRTADTNKFLREDSNKALDAMIDSIKFSKSIILLTQKVATHTNALIRASAARLLYRLIENHGPSRIMSLKKEKRELVINTVVKFVMDGNLQTRIEGKKIFQLLSMDRKTAALIIDIIPTGVIATINRSLSRINSSN